MAEMLEVVMRDNVFFSCGGIKQAVRGRSQPGQWVSSIPSSSSYHAARLFQNEPELNRGTEKANGKLIRFNINPPLTTPYSNFVIRTAGNDKKFTCRSEAVHFNVRMRAENPLQLMWSYGRVKAIFGEISKC